MHPSRIGFYALATLAALAVRSSATPPSDPAEKAKLIGQPLALEASPANIAVSGPRGMQQVIVTGRYADGSLRDLTPFASWKVELAEIAEVLNMPVNTVKSTLFRALRNLRGQLMRKVKEARYAFL